MNRRTWLVAVLAGLLAGNAPAAPPHEARVAEAAKDMADLQKAYMAGDWDKLERLHTAAKRQSAFLTPGQRKDLIYIQRAAAAYRPKWWRYVTRASNTTFTARIWGREFKANFIPSNALGGQAPIGIEGGKLINVVTWRPQMIDDPDELKGWLAKKHGITKGHAAEAIVWHELGHNYVSNFLPLKHVLELYRNHSIIYFHLQEFYADMTSLYHSDPPARRLAMMFRTDSLEANDTRDPHVRAGHAIGAMILAEVLSDPSKWPSFHLPKKTPPKDPERVCILHLWDHLDPGWTFAEDKAIRSLVYEFIRRKGKLVLTSRATVFLDNGLRFKLPLGEDREHQKKRNAWVVEKLKAIHAAAKRATPAEGEIEPERPESSKGFTGKRPAVGEGRPAGPGPVGFRRVWPRRIVPPW